MKHARLGAGFTLLLLVTIPVFSHDYWFQPQSFFAPVGGSVRVRLLVGDEFKMEEERPFQRERTVNFQMLSGQRGMTDLAAAGQDTQLPVARPNLKSAGNYLIAMERQAATIVSGTVERRASFFAVLCESS